MLIPKEISVVTKTGKFLSNLKHHLKLDSLAVERPHIMELLSVLGLYRGIEEFETGNARL